MAGIKDYPEIFKLNINKIKKNIKKIPLVSNVKIKRNILGKITFIIEEDKVLFYINQKGKYITSSGKMVDDNNNLDEFIMSGSVSDYDILNYEDSVAMSNEEAPLDNNQ